MNTILGTTDAVSSCDCCGRQKLKRTVAIQLADGTVAHYGTSCAAGFLKADSAYVRTVARSADEAIRLAAEREVRRLNGLAFREWDLFLSVATGRKPATDKSGNGLPANHIDREDGILEKITALGGYSKARALFLSRKA